MAEKILLLLGTKKGAFIAEAGKGRKRWSLRGPYCETWPINHVKADPETGVIYAAGGDMWFGPAVWKSTDLGRRWTHSSAGLTYKKGEEPVKSVWSIGPAGKRLYAGVEPAGLFVSEDGGEKWRHLKALRDHPSREHWMPGGGGLILHHLVPHPHDPKRLWLAISSAGVFYTEDGGRSFTPRNQGTRLEYVPEHLRYPEFGQCVHSLVMAPGRPDRLYQQNHFGMYVSEDGGLSWESIEAGLPSTFGFPAAAHPHDPDTLFLLPLNGDQAGRYVPDAKAAVWRTRDRGKRWKALRKGLPQKDVYFGVLRQAMATDSRDPVGVYFGTNTGQLYASADEGVNWTRIAEHLPPIYSVETLAVDA